MSQSQLPAQPIAEIIELVRPWATEADIALVMTAYLLAARAHHGHTRKSGEDYLYHPLEVARMLAEMGMDAETVATGLLHDTLEDTPLTMEELTDQVGPVVTELVDGVTKIGKLQYRSKQELEAENFRKMMIAMARDLRVILVKLADRLHNMRTLDGHGSADKQRLIATETIQIYAPIANRLGLVKIKSELEDLCLRYIEPAAWQRITEYLERTQADREAYTSAVVKRLQAEVDRSGLDGKVTGRAKSVHGIWQKMVRNDLDVEGVQDQLAFRIVLRDQGAPTALCYQALAVVHDRFKPVHGRFKDYIARPKPNGYQSLHTTVEDADGKVIEVQIRTEDMHRFAEEGVAAHWKYKESGRRLSRDDIREIARMRGFFEAAQDAEHAPNAKEAAKHAFYADEVFVYTPAGHIKALPAGATALDFAFTVHSDVGMRCVGVRVNGKLVPLRTVLRNEDRVEVLTDANQVPRRDWLDITTTNRAQSRIRRFLRQQEEEGAQRVGVQILEAELRRLDWTTARAAKEGRLDAYLRERGFKNIEPLLVELAKGHVSAGEVARGVLPEGAWVSREDAARQNRLSAILKPKSGKRSTSAVRISGESDLLFDFARCCNPLPGEEVVGFITRGSGISVHRSDCRELNGLASERILEVDWDLSTNSRHSNTLRIRCSDRTGLLAQITKVCETAGVNIESAEANAPRSSREDAMVVLQLGLRDVSELSRLIRSIQAIPGVVDVRRGD